MINVIAQNIMNDSTKRLGAELLAKNDEACCQRKIFLHIPIPDLIQFYGRYLKDSSECLCSSSKRELNSDSVFCADKAWLVSSQQSGLIHIFHLSISPISLCNLVNSFFASFSFTATKAEKSLKLKRSKRKDSVSRKPRDIEKRG